MIAQEGKAGRKIGEKWSAILVPSPTASNTPNRIAAASWTYCTRDRGLAGVLPREVRAYKRFRATGRNGRVTAK
jgi:hypothetical protein